MTDLGAAVKYERQRFWRSREVFFKADDVKTDGLGNIVSRPLEKRKLECFADPVQSILGTIDKLNRFKNPAGDPSRCAGCKVLPICRQIAMERIETSPELIDAYNTWNDQAHSAGLVGEAQFNTAAWLAFVAARERIEWTDCNDVGLADHKKRQDLARLAGRKDKRAAKRRRRSVPQAVLDAIVTERDRREQMLLVLRTSEGAPRYVSKMSEDGCKRTADVWAAEQRLLAMGGEFSIADVAREIGGPEASASFQTRVREASIRCGRLHDEGHWEEFGQKTGPANGLAEGMITHMLEPV